MLQLRAETETETTTEKSTSPTFPWLCFRASSHESENRGNKQLSGSQTKNKVWESAGAISAGAILISHHVSINHPITATTAPFDRLPHGTWFCCVKEILSWTGPCNTPGPCNTRLIQPITINFSHSFRYISKLYTAIIFSVKFETLLNVSIEDIVNSRTHLVWISKILNFFALCLSISETK